MEGRYKRRYRRFTQQQIRFRAIKSKRGDREDADLGAFGRHTKASRGLDEDVEDDDQQDFFHGHGGFETDQVQGSERRGTKRRNDTSQFEAGTRVRDELHWDGPYGRERYGVRGGTKQWFAELSAIASTGGAYSTNLFGGIGLVGMPRGTGARERIGNKSHVVSVGFRGWMITEHDEVAEDIDIARAVFFRDRACHRATTGPTPSMLLGEGDGYAFSSIFDFRNPDNMDRFDVLFDKVVNVTPPVGCVGYHVYQTTPADIVQSDLVKFPALSVVPLEFSVDTDFSVNYGDLSTGGDDNIVSNNVYCLFYRQGTPTATNNVVLTGKWRCVYDDC